MSIGAYLFAFMAGVVSLGLYFNCGMSDGTISLVVLLGFVVISSLVSGLVNPRRWDIPLMHSVPSIGGNRGQIPII